MSIQALKFTDGASDAEPRPCELAPESLAALLTLENAPELPAAYVVRIQDLEQVRACKDAVVDRGRKHKAKGLSELLLGYPQIPCIDGNYTDAGQLRRSLRTLLANALHHKDRNLYLIGTEDAIFNKLWEHIPAARSTKHTDSMTPMASLPMENPPLTSIGASAAQHLLELLPPCDVPEGLQTRYAGASVEIQLVRRLIFLAAQQKEPVLILGDTGTGKELVARAIHNYGGRSSKTFTAINCGAIPSELLESELFGHEKGAFTGADFKKDGLWKVADGGTLFLDEIGDLRLDHQVKFLRALQEGKVRPLGAKDESAVDVRVIAATNRDLFSMVQAGKFREDLYYRLRRFLIHTPALRDHREDIPALAQSYWQRITGNDRRVLPAEILAELQSGHYRWPGNVRELNALLSQLHALFGEKNAIGIADLRAVLQFEGQDATLPQDRTEEREINLHRVQCLRHLRQVDEVVRACKVMLRPIVKDATAERQTIESIQTMMGYRLSELESLCLRPLLFHHEITFSAVYRLKGKLSYFQSLIQRDLKDALRYWKADVKGEFKSITSALFQEVERLLMNV